MKSVVICGSRRFEKGIRMFENSLRKAGVVVYSPYLHQGKDEWSNMSEQYKNYTALGLTHDHFHKIRMADVVFIYNEAGYSGNSTTLELGFAMALAKPIYALTDEDEERCRKVLIRGVCKTTRELLKYLK